MSKLEEHRKIWQGKSDEWLFERLANELTEKVEEIHKLLAENEQLRLYNVNQQLVSNMFSDMVGFGRWLLQSGNMGNLTRYIYIESSDDFIDNDGQRYKWEELYKIYINH